MRSIKKIQVLVLLLLATLFTVSGCQKESVPEPEPTDDSTPQISATEKAIVVYFSRIGEQTDVGFISEGNTAIVAKMIAEKTGADLFEIKPSPDKYNVAYDQLTQIAKKEKDSKARPAFAKPIPDFSQYDVVFFGSPVWWGDWPMIMYSFFEDVPLEGKKLLPFSTHAGSNLAGFNIKLMTIYPYCTILPGFSITGTVAQTDRVKTEKLVDQWLRSLGLDPKPLAANLPDESAESTDSGAPQAE